jgi:predicted MPP superfamily phosphohydrolase
MILRFRDLAGPTGSTITRHEELITKEGAVWWAWWNKPNERIPRDVFADFKQSIREHGPLHLYLADSGKNLLYTAEMAEIREAETEDPIISPNPVLTPQYYRDTPYKAWFRLRRIVQVAPGDVEEELHKWSYDEVQQFTEDPFWESYQDKRVFSLDELLHRRHRTIYFIQPYAIGHKVHLVETLPGVQPQDFIMYPLVGQSSFILHLSDLHFGPEHGFPTSEDEPGKRSLARLIIDDLRNHVNLGAPACVIISGDLTWQANSEEFHKARTFIERLGSEFALEPYNFIVVPGNHDIKWTDDPARKGSAPADRVKFPKDEAKANFRDFYTKLFGLAPNPFFSQGRRFLLKNYVTVDVLGLSSSELEQDHFAGYGFVNSEQLTEAIKKMAWREASPRTTYRVVTLHHHLIPVVPEEEIRGFNKNYSITLDAGHIISECLMTGVDMVVHGHQHHPFTGVLMRSPQGAKFDPARTLVVSAAGSAGVAKKHIPSGRNSYSIYEFCQDRVQIRLRAKSEGDVGFVEAGEWESELMRNPAGGMILKSKH